MTFSEFLAACGLRPKAIQPGRWLRCPTENHPRKKNGSYKLADDGQVGWAIDYAVHSEHQVWRPDEHQVIHVDRAAIASRQAQERADAKRATRTAIAHYRTASLLQWTHPYLEAKGLDTGGCSGLRVDAQGRLVVPMLTDGNLVSVQTITPSGDKRFWPGAPTRGASLTLGSPGMLTVLCEGLATGLTLYRALKCQVIVAFNAGNLGEVADNLPRLGLAVIAADNDHETAKRIGINPGLDKAREVAERLGFGVAYPVCAGSDWDDYRQERTRAITETEALKRRPRAAKQISEQVNAEIAMAVRKEAKRRWMAKAQGEVHRVTRTGETVTLERAHNAELRPPGAGLSRQSSLERRVMRNNTGD